MDKVNYKIIDNVLPQQTYSKISKGILDYPFDWYYSAGIVKHADYESNGGYFTHMFFYSLYGENVISSKYELIKPIIHYLQPTILLRAKANLYPKYKGEKEPEVHGYHSDYQFPNSAAIYYLNTNNGFTILNDGTKIRSIANRLLLFEGHISHSSTNCTDAAFRANINFNYLKPEIPRDTPEQVEENLKNKIY